MHLTVHAGMINLELKFENEQNTYHMHISLPESEVQE